MYVSTQAGLHQDAARLAAGLDRQEQSLPLQIAIKYEQNDIAGQPRSFPRCGDVRPNDPHMLATLCHSSVRLQGVKGCLRSCLLATLTLQ